MKKKVSKSAKKPAKVEVKKKQSQPMTMALKSPKKIVERQTSILDDEEDLEDDLEEIVNDDTQDDDEGIEEMDENELPDVPDTDNDSDDESGEESKGRAKFNYHVTFYTEESGFDYREFIKKSELGKFIASLESAPYKIVKGRLIEPKKRVIVTFG